jgi:hypothetical protein
MIVMYLPPHDQKHASHVSSTSHDCHVSSSSYDQKHASHTLSQGPGAVDADQRSWPGSRGARSEVGGGGGGGGAVKVTAPTESKDCPLFDERAIMERFVCIERERDVFLYVYIK